MLAGVDLRETGAALLLSRHPTRPAPAMTNLGWRADGRRYARLARRAARLALMRRQADASLLVGSNVPRGRAKSRMRPTCVGFGRRAGVAMTVPPSAHPSDTWTGRVGGVRKRRSPSAAERLEDRPAAERVSTSSWAMAAVTISTASHSLARRNHGAVPHDALDDGGSGLVG